MELDILTNYDNIDVAHNNVTVNNTDVKRMSAIHVTTVL